MSRRQQGFTLIGWIFILAVVGVFALAGLRLVPIYLEYLKINSTLDSVRAEFQAGGDVNPSILRTAIEKRFDIEGVSIIEAGAIKIERRGDFYHVQAAYDHEAPFIGNVYLLARFNKSVEIPS